MLPFCGYNMGDYFGHWLALGERSALLGTKAELPKVYLVNWFRKDAQGQFVWPGFGDNSRVLKWVVDRLEGRAGAVDSPIGRLPEADSLDLDGLGLTPEQTELLLTFDEETWREEATLIGEHYASLGSHLPQSLHDELLALTRQLTPG
jgi:phosphoenolpyruvate carboxykinase (GTP)